MFQSISEGQPQNDASRKMVDDNFLEQFISGPTRIAGNKLAWIFYAATLLNSSVVAFVHSFLIFPSRSLHCKK